MYHLRHVIYEIFKLNDIHTKLKSKKCIINQNTTICKYYYNCYVFQNKRKLIIKP